ncbi:uncharacterized protein AC631_03094 [Debaryomyces fabryi]|uniref:Acyl-CoA thioesterase II n=1 Tax=Debaryomyces fabryi TaxID=58627 RepID=A0A0V1PY43_9ASCO|nr:uncharacterized protein AC631_03094 [Debaryomyces fabryi]KSA01153.1 hypothetical protein AC631_03094 [Debaryomyces fabryi]CUM46383.1 unnamed protein product [Debaryomyces fabryi]
MSIEEIYNNVKVCKLEEKFSLKKLSDTVLEGNYPLEPFKEGARGTYGGEFVSQGLLAAWETVDDPDFSPHSFHSYFLKAGSIESVMRWEVTKTMEGRNYCNRLVHCYQQHNNQLCFILTASFTRNNSIQQRKLDYETNPGTKIPFEFQRSPQYFFEKYYDKLDDMQYFEHTNGNLQHIVPPEYFTGMPSDFLSQETGMRDIGFFVRVNDDISLAKDELKARLISMAFASDSFYLSLLVCSLGIPLSIEIFNFFRVSLDHTVYFHDTDFDPTKWLFLDYRFSRMSNDRVLCQCQVFNEKGTMVVSIVQEAIALIPKKYIDKAVGGSYKL